MEREQAMELHSLFFCPDSEAEVENLLDYIDYKSILGKKDRKALKKLLKKVELISWTQIEHFDKSQL